MARACAPYVDAVSSNLKHPVTATQKERALGFRNTLHALVRTPYLIGADWFQYYGRYDGENFNFGCVVNIPGVNGEVRNELTWAP